MSSITSSIPPGTYQAHCIGCGEREGVDLLALEQELRVREERLARLGLAVHRPRRAHDQAQVLHVQVVEAHVVDVRRRDAALRDRLVDGVVEGREDLVGEELAVALEQLVVERRLGRRPRRSSAPTRASCSLPSKSSNWTITSRLTMLMYGLTRLGGAVEGERHRIAGRGEVDRAHRAHAVLGRREALAERRAASRIAAGRSPRGHTSNTPSNSSNGLDSRAVSGASIVAITHLLASRRRMLGQLFALTHLPSALRPLPVGAVLRAEGGVAEEGSLRLGRTARRSVVLAHRRLRLPHRDASASRR